MEDRVQWSLLGGPVAPGWELASRPQALLALLLTRANQTVSSDRLIDGLWAGAAPATARNSIARFVADIRRGLGARRDRIVTEHGGYRVIVHDDELDWECAQRSHRMAVELEESDADGALHATTIAIDRFARWPSSVVQGLVDADVLLREQEELWVTLLEHDIELRLRLGLLDGLVMELEVLVGEHPYNENLWARLMQALHRTGRRTEALRTYRRLAGVLADVGLEPTNLLRDLASRLSDEEPVGVLARAGQHGSPTQAATGLGVPTLRRSFVGRVAEIEDIGTASAANRLVTIVGLGGMGKTSVAAEVSRRLLANGTHVRFVALESVGSPALVVAAIASALGASEGDVDSPNALGSLLGDRSLLLVLDRCEGVLDACRDVAGAILDLAPNVTVLATSRVPLRVDGEFVYRLGPMTLLAQTGEPEHSAAAIELFMARAREASSSIRAHPDTIERVTAICHAVDGVPVAIELAAAQMAYMAPQDLLDRLLTSTDHDGVLGDRGHTSFGRVMQWCWDSLTVAQQSLLARLTVFSDSWSLDAATVVCGDGVPVDGDLAELVNKSLLSIVPQRGRARYRMLETVRAFAHDRLCERAEVAQYSDRLVAWLQEMMGRYEIADLHMCARGGDLLEPEQASTHAALAYLESVGRVEDAAWMAVRSCGVWVHRGSPLEARRWLTPMTVDARLSTAARSAAMAALADVEARLSKLRVAQRLAARSIDLAAGRPWDWVPNAAGLLAVMRPILPMPQSADELFRIAASAAERSPSPATNAALVAIRRGHDAFGHQRFAMALEHFLEARSHQPERGRALLLSELGIACARYMTGEHATAVHDVNGWVSRADTDRWHYAVDVIGAIIRGGAGDPSFATTALIGVARASGLTLLDERADDFQIAFGMLADFRGERELAEDLLATPRPRQTLLHTMLVDHLVRFRGVASEHGRAEIFSALMGRRFLGDAGGAPMLQDSDSLIEWWTSGDRPFPSIVSA